MQQQIVWKQSDVVVKGFHIVLDPLSSHLNLKPGPKWSFYREPEAMLDPDIDCYWSAWPSTCFISHNVMYCIVLHGIVWYCRVLYGICIVLYGTDQDPPPASSPINIKHPSHREFKPYHWTIWNKNAPTFSNWPIVTAPAHKKLSIAFNCSGWPFKL